jgi:YesN/AraC family two-component response regulator
MYKLLIVDDEPKILEGVKITLDWSGLGFVRVETAQNYEDAVNIAIEMEPDIALFDVCIGAHFGFDIINHLNKMKLKTIYIMISGYGEFEYAKQALLCGAKAYLLKPVDRSELQEIIQQVIITDLGGTLPDIAKSKDHIDSVSGIPYSRFSKLTNKIIVIIKAEYKSSINLKVVADKFKMNSAYLGQIFLKETRMKFSEYLMIFRLQKAHEMILGTGDKIHYIAKQVGYNNLNYFYTQFRDYYDVSPSDLRRGGN